MIFEKKNFSQSDFGSRIIGLRVIKCYFMQYSRLCHFLGASHVTLSNSLFRQFIFIEKNQNWIFPELENFTCDSKMTDFGQKFAIFDHEATENGPFRPSKTKCWLENFGFRLENSQFWLKLPSKSLNGVNQCQLGSISV